MLSIEYWGDANEDDIFSVVEGLMRKIFKDTKGIELDEFKRIPYDECMSRFGSDKPDLRFEMEIVNITDIFKNTELLTTFCQTFLTRSAKI